MMDWFVKAFLKAYRWKGPVFAIAAISGEGCRPLTFASVTTPCPARLDGPGGTSAVMATL